MGKIEEFQGEFRFLSNFYWGYGKPVEFAYQSAKTLDPKEQNWILSASTPGEAKRRGQKVTVRPDWEEIKVPTMLALLREKFESFELRKLLLSTGHQEIIEGNKWHDNFWGVCNCGRCKGGQNQLGKLLMQVREEIKGDF